MLKIIVRLILTKTIFFSRSNKDELFSFLRILFYVISKENDQVGFF